MIKQKIGLHGRSMRLPAQCSLQFHDPEPDETKLEQRIYTFWCGADNNWKDTPVLPESNYKFDFFAWQWIEITE
jgi:hypothetical protein